jgi:hypothetical protein
LYLQLATSTWKYQQVEEYTLNFYVIVKEKDTGMGAFELLVDKYTGADIARGWALTLCGTQSTACTME